MMFFGVCPWPLDGHLPSGYTFCVFFFQQFYFLILWEEILTCQVGNVITQAVLGRLALRHLVFCPPRPAFSGCYLSFT